MPFVVQSSREDPTVDVVVADAATGAPLRMTVLTGVVALAPENVPRMRVSVRGQQPVGEPAGFYPPGATALPLAGDITAWVELALTQVTVTGFIDNADIAYGVGGAAVQLVEAPDRSGRWPFVTCTCFGAQPIGVRYRLTIVRPA
jgi:hypothetical protein